VGNTTERKKDDRVAGWRALVTGASSGIGASLAAELASRGADLVLTARRQERLEALATDLRGRHGVDVRVVAADLSEPGAADALFARTEGEGLAIDMLVNNAGIGWYKSFVATPWETASAMLQVNVVSLTHLTRLFVPRMLERGRGHVLNVASIGAYSPCPGFAVYAPSKAYVRNFTVSLAFALRRTGVRATCVCPGGVTTEFLEAADQRLKAGGERMMMSADQCARISLDKALAGRRTVVPGWMNALGMWLLRFVPRAWMPWLAGVSMSTTVHRPTA
jgi:uncharacterized protein